LGEIGNHNSMGKKWNYKEKLMGLQNAPPEARKKWLELKHEQKTRLARNWIEHVIVELCQNFQRSFIDELLPHWLLETEIGQTFFLSSHIYRA